MKKILRMLKNRKCISRMSMHFLAYYVFVLKLNFMDLNMCQQIKFSGTLLNIYDDGLELLISLPSKVISDATNEIMYYILNLKILICGRFRICEFLNETMICMQYKVSDWS